jgi:hypothetical protein
MVGIDLETQRAAIERVVHEYYDSWYAGDPNRMERSLHPNLAKRAPMGQLIEVGLRPNADPEGLDEDTRQTMVDATARGIGASRATTSEDRTIEVRIDDLYDWIAAVTVRTPIYHEYLHLVRTADGWRIVNALWQRTLAEGGDGTA